LAENDTALTLTADLPGLSDKDVTLSVTADELTVKATRHIELPAGYRTHRQERSDYMLAESYALPTQVDPERVEAKMKDGVLTVTLPKVQKAQPRTIAVAAE